MYHPRFDLLQWQPAQDDKWDFKKDRISPEKENEAKKYPLRINHEKNNWVTEQKDNYRPISKVGDNYVQRNNSLPPSLLEISKERLKDIENDCRPHQEAHQA